MTFLACNECFILNLLNLEANDIWFIFKAELYFDVLNRVLHIAFSHVSCFREIQWPMEFYKGNMDNYALFTTSFYSKNQIVTWYNAQFSKK